MLLVQYREVGHCPGKRTNIQPWGQFRRMGLLRLGPPRYVPWKKRYTGLQCPITHKPYPL